MHCEMPYFSTHTAQTGAILSLLRGFLLHSGCPLHQDSAAVWLRFPDLLLCTVICRGNSNVDLQVDVFTPFSALLQHLWALWEMMLLAEPLLVVSPSPGGSLPPPLPQQHQTSPPCLPTLQLLQRCFVLLSSYLSQLVLFIRNVPIARSSMFSIPNLHLNVIPACLLA